MVRELFIVFDIHSVGVFVVSPPLDYLVKVKLQKNSIFYVHKTEKREENPFTYLNRHQSFG